MRTKEQTIELAKLQVRYYQSIIDSDPIAIEYRMCKHELCGWIECSTPAWFEDCEYREKPSKPITTWAVVEGNEVIGSFIDKKHAGYHMAIYGGNLVEMVEKHE